MKTWLPGLLAVALLTASPRADACGPFFVKARFVPPTHPERPFSDYAAGQLGVPLLTWRPMFLAYAYRTMTGVPTSPAEQQALLSSWAREMSDPQVDAAIDPELTAWRKARAELPGAGSPPEVETRGEAEYATYERINVDAFQYAAKTAQSLAKAWKARPALLTEWRTAQDVIFGPCAPLPVRAEGVNADLTPGERSRRDAERAYQEAAHAFYCGEFPPAEKAFRAIAATPDSPHRGLGLYLAARALVRQVQLGNNMNEATVTALITEAEQLLGKVLADARSSQARTPARRLLGFIRFRYARDARRCELFARVLEKGTGTALEAELIDFTHLYEPTASCPGLKGDAADLEAWMRATRPGEQLKSYALARERWKKTARLPWLLTALMTAFADSPGLDELLADAGKVPTDSPAHVGLSWYAGHLLREQGRPDEARARLGQVPRELRARFPSLDNLLRQEELWLATSWDEVFRAAPRRLAGLDAEYDSLQSDAPPEPPEKRPSYFDEAGRYVLGPALTARRLWELSRYEALPAALKRQVGWAAFAKATVVGDDDTLRTASQGLAESEPAARQELKRLLERPTAEDRRFDAQVLLMGLPVVSPFLEPEQDRGWSTDPKFKLVEDESYERNWWCGPQGAAPTPYPFAFVPEEERQRAGAEWKQLVEAGNAVSWFGRLAVEWAKAHPEDPRSPVALGRVVRASKRGCAGQKTKEATAAFRLLHQRYPKSEQARRAPHVF